MSENNLEVSFGSLSRTEAPHHCGHRIEIGIGSGLITVPCNKPATHMDVDITGAIFYCGECATIPENKGCFPISPTTKGMRHPILDEMFDSENPDRIQS